jgi:hydrogenase expression/formation protein HypC
MCLAIPGKVLSKEDRAGTLTGRVDFGGVAREVQLDFVPEVEVGEYVIVHVGFALSRLDAEEAARTFDLLKQMEALAEEGFETESVVPGSKLET